MDTQSLIGETSFKLKEHSIFDEGSRDSRFGGEIWNFVNYLNELKIEIKNIDDTVMEFDLINIDAAIANAIRRIIIAEVPTMAIDRVLIYNNTSLIPDEVLAHRLGLIPIKVDPRLFQYVEPGDENGTEEDTIKFQLKVKCKRANNPTSEHQYEHGEVYSKDLHFIPLGNQKEMYGDIRPVYEDILLDKLQPGHEIEVEAHCVKNIGRVHSKFSPVATAWYRLLPQIQLKEEITNERAYRLADCFADGVIKISKKKGGKEIAKVRDARKITCSRNIFKHDDLKDAVEVSKVKNHFIFTVESTGALPPETLVAEAINVLREKCRFFLKELNSLKM